MLEAELRLFVAHQAEWAARFPGQYVLVKGDELVGAFRTEVEALVHGVRLFGLQSYLVRSVDEPDLAVSNPALAVGALHADPQYAVHG